MYNNVFNVKLEKWRHVTKIEYLLIKGYMRTRALALSRDLHLQSNSAETLGLWNCCTTKNLGLGFSKWSSCKKLTRELQYWLQLVDYEYLYWDSFFFLKFLSQRKGILKKLKDKEKILKVWIWKIERIHLTLVSFDHCSVWRLTYNTVHLIELYNWPADRYDCMN